MASNHIYGIDLGTTYSCIAYVDEFGRPTVLPNAEGDNTTPSVVYFESSANIVVGQAAKEVAVLYPELVISSVKRLMGNPDWQYEHEGNTLHPQDISSFILRKLVTDAEAITGNTIKDVVITCPAYFGVTQKEATRQAGELAGLNVRYVIPEPTAAAIAYGIERSEPQVILVYDLGGGTFDVTVIDIQADGIRVICTGGDHDLGGNNWDEDISNWYAEEFSKDKAVNADDLTEDMETWQDLLSTSEGTKKALSSKTSHKQRIQHGVDRAVIDLTREKFEEITSNHVERTISLTRDLLNTAEKKGYNQIDKLLLVGGSTYMPHIRSRIAAEFSDFEVLQFDPNQAVAKGAALYGLKCALDDRIKVEVATELGCGTDDIAITDADAAVVERAEQKVSTEHGLSLPAVRNLTQTTIRNVTSKSFGIVVADQAPDDLRVNNLVVADDAVPCSVTREYTTVQDNQAVIKLTCMENTERVGSDDGLLDLETSTELGSTELKFAKPLPQGAPVEVTFSLSEDGLLSVFARDLTTKTEIQAEFQTHAILTPEQVQEKLSRNMSIAVS